EQKIPGTQGGCCMAEQRVTPPFPVAITTAIPKLPSGPHVDTAERIADMAVILMGRLGIPASDALPIALKAYADMMDPNALMLPRFSPHPSLPDVEVIPDGTTQEELRAMIKRRQDERARGER